MQWLDPDFIFQTVLPALNRGLVMSIALIVPSASGTASPPSSAACRSWCSS